MFVFVYMYNMYNHGKAMVNDGTRPCFYDGVLYFFVGKSTKNRYHRWIDLTVSGLCRTPLGRLWEWSHNRLSLQILIWLVVSTPLKNISQLGLFFPTYGKIKNVPNHQPEF